MSQLPFRDFYDAIKRNDIVKLQQILTDHPGFLQEDVGAESWLQIAAKYADIATVEFFVQVGLDVTPALEDAVLYDRVDVARLLLDHGAKILTTDVGWGGAPLLAVAIDSVKMTQLLLDRGADPNVSWGSPPTSVLSKALDRGRTEVAELLLAHGATPTAPAPESPVTLREEIVRHFALRIGPVEPLSIAEIVPGEVAVSVHIVPPAPGHGYLLLFTTGMSDRALTVPAGREDDRYAELVLLLPSDWKLNPDSLADSRSGWAIEWLRRAAHFFHEHRTWIGPGYGILANGSPPQPLAPGLPFDSLLLFHPESGTAQVRVADGREIRFYTVYPLHPDERFLETHQGPAALLERLAPQASFPIIDVHRPSAVG
ncbi:Suppressor of fused protein (SUFU) [Gemmata sp. SH-PL17]|uniref:suppressor of fused domain protein n=1 Tax=Gemmata sp. SH-PL17 TaxID=1630693 RepID=UPI00078B4E76|nr:suppressor of fused domain protein [Gemmata sp. SH-PL17]AMV28183.1 Suppressor of fused protein (SUFU) [Gemmata sp. SH-PL17]